MRVSFIYIVIAVKGFIFPVDDFGKIASAVGPIQIEVIDLANEQDVENFYRLHYQVAKVKVTKSPVLIFHAQFKGGLSGGKASTNYGVATIATVIGAYIRNLQVALHEWGHLRRMRHVSADQGCYIMNPQPCGLEFDAVNIKRAQKLRGRRG